MASKELVPCLLWECRAALIKLLLGQGIYGVWGVGGVWRPIETPSSNGSLYVLPEATLRDGPPRNRYDERALHRSFRQQLVGYIPVPAGTKVYGA